MPLRQEDAHIVHGEITHRGGGVAFTEPRRVAIADDAAGDHIAASGIGAREGVHQTGDPPAQAGVRNLIQSIEQDRGAPGGQPVVEEVGRHLDPLVLQPLHQKPQQQRMAVGAVVLRVVLRQIAADLT